MQRYIIDTKIALRLFNILFNSFQEKVHKSTKFVNKKIDVLSSSTNLFIMPQNTLTLFLPFLHFLPHLTLFANLPLFWILRFSGRNWVQFSVQSWKVLAKSRISSRWGAQTRWGHGEYAKPKPMRSEELLRYDNPHNMVLFLRGQQPQFRHKMPNNTMKNKSMGMYCCFLFTR